jgi:hypothetical protein
MEVHEVLAAGQRILQKPPKNVEKAVNALIASYIDHSLVYLSKEMWRHAMATSTQQPDSPFGKTYTSLDRALADQTCALIAKLQELGLVGGDIDGRGVGEMLFNSMNMMFMEFIKREDMTIKEIRAKIRRQNRTLVQAISV